MFTKCVNKPFCNCIQVLAFDNNDEEDTASLDAMSVSTVGGGSRTNKSTQSRGVGGGGKGGQSDVKLVDEQLNDDLKNLDEKRMLE